ncbi:type II toxin-antitoxin system RelE/ParE family toxin [Pedobacter fastidiosus]|uniref:Type II toxin-antitoxin system RelE/ParE family toxin n=1 Tax=Pedobacter fastidiosus TaxID=2765361 RepID=A0ABR7KT05_9SPHI|nr:type II toxin-antitoxin system RelE/ParE family toxin [Pedobacter fastidiosus]MBC6111069.1 type II toxin-antitoxin system RelE/ParE family toxin [Pedobacter fastidiosus]
MKKLCKKHKSAKNDLITFVENLREDPLQGTPIGNDCYKIRITISSKGKGKSAGARLITRVRIVKEKIYLLSIYDKSEQDSISDKELETVLKSIED